MGWNHMKRVILFIIIWNIILGQSPIGSVGSGCTLKYNANGYVLVVDNPTLDMSRTFTLEAWIKADISTLGSIISKWSYCPDGSIPFKGTSFLLSQQTGDLVFSVSKGGNYFYLYGWVIVPNGIIDTNWHHVAVTFDNGQVRMYIDGILRRNTFLSINTADPNARFVVSGSCAEYWLGDTLAISWCGYPWTNYSGLLVVDTMYISNEDVRIGAAWSYCGYISQPSELYTGQIDEVRIWNYARTQTEIRRDMCRRLTGTESGLVGYWRFDECGGNTAFDSSGNGNDGTLY